MIDFAHRRIDYWRTRTHRTDGNDYSAAIALLRAVYDIVDRVKRWEVQRNLNGGAAFAARCQELQRAYDELETRLGIPTGMRAGSLLQRLIGRLR